MRLSAFARSAIKAAQVNGYATDASRASDPLIRPFAEFDEQKAILRSLQESTLALCWIDASFNLIPIDANQFDAVRTEILRLQSMIDHNALVLNELDAKATELGIQSLGAMHSEKSKILERIAEIKSEEVDSLRSKWHAIVIVGGDRGAYDKLPEVIAAKAKTAELVEPLEAEINAIDENVQCLQAILRKIKKQ